MFYFRLARHVFHCSVCEMLARVGSRELSEWQAYDALEPLDSDARAELTGGIIASTLANCHSTDGGFKASDFIQVWGAEYRESESTAESAAKSVEDAAKILGLEWGK